MKRLVRLFKSNEGFTLIELMIAMAVIVLALVGYIGANSAIQRTGEAAFERSVAIQDANRVLEQMRSAAALGEFPQSVLDAFPNGGTVAGFTSLSNQQVRVNYIDASADPLDATVTVTWRQNGLRDVSVTLRTLMTQRG